MEGEVSARGEKEKRVGPQSSQEDQGGTIFEIAPEATQRLGEGPSINKLPTGG